MENINSLHNNCGLGVRVMVFDATFNSISAISCGHFYWCMKLEYLEKSTDQSQANNCDKM